jgi:hypothetical protein
MKITGFKLDFFHFLDKIASSKSKFCIDCQLDSIMILLPHYHSFQTLNQLYLTKLKIASLQIHSTLCRMGTRQSC